MRIVVLGASGNVGTSVLGALGADTSVHEIVGVARRVPEQSFAKTTWVGADVRSADLVRIFRGADVVIHLAWLIQPSRDERLTGDVNVRGSQRVFDAAARAEVPALVYASSVGVYAPARSAAPVDEAWPASGIASSYYSRQKAAVEPLLNRFEQVNPRTRVVRLRPALIFKAAAASEIRRLFLGPFVPSALLRPGAAPVLPYPRGLRTQAVHSLDVGEACRLAATTPVSGAFNLAADGVLDADALSGLLSAPAVQAPVALVRGAAWASWKLRLQPTSPGWLDMGMRSPIMDTLRAREQLGWAPSRTALESMAELLEGISGGAGLRTPPLDPRTGGRLRWREIASGVGTRAGG